MVPQSMANRGRGCFFLHVVACTTLLAVAKQAEAQQAVLGDDAACLRGFRASMNGEGGSLSRWTSDQIAVPCNVSTGPGEGIVCNNGRIFSIGLNASGLSGTIPSSLANCTYLQTVDLSSNSLSGFIPSVLGTLAYLTSLNFSVNQLTGSIPVEFSTCIYLNVIDLHHNRLSGSIPGQLGLLNRLKVFDVSDNQLSGSIPSTLSNFTSTGAPRFNVSSFRGNKDLYGFPLPAPQRHGLSVPAIVGIGLGSGFLSFVLSFTAVCIWLRATKHGYAAEEGKISQLAYDS